MVGKADKKSWGLFVTLLVITSMMLNGCQIFVDPNPPGFYLMQSNGKPASHMKFRAICENGEVVESVTNRMGLLRLKKCSPKTIQLFEGKTRDKLGTASLYDTNSNNEGIYIKYTGDRDVNHGW